MKYRVEELIGGIWKTPGVSEEPLITLIRWRIIEITRDAGECERHLVGYNQNGWEGRVSTAIITVAGPKRKCITKSGRVYRLEGPPGFDPDAEYVWRMWASANNVTSERDISDSFHFEK